MAETKKAEKTNEDERKPKKRDVFFKCPSCNANIRVELGISQCPKCGAYIGVK